MLQPTRTKYRKAHKGRIHGQASRGELLNYGTYGLKARPAPSNDVALRIEAVDTALSRLLDGKPGFLLDTKCINL